MVVIMWSIMTPQTLLSGSRWENIYIYILTWCGILMSGTDQWSMKLNNLGLETTKYELNGPYIFSKQFLSGDLYKEAE